VLLGWKVAVSVIVLSPVFNHLLEGKAYGLERATSWDPSCAGR
jgi:hypothetical protein